MSTRSSAWRPTLAFAGTVTGVLATFRLMELLIARLGQLPAAAYNESFFLDNLIARWLYLASSRFAWWLAAGAVAIAVAMVVDARRFGGFVGQRFIALFAGWGAL